MQRLQTRAQFQAVLAGRTIARTRHFALHRVALLAPETAQPPEVAATPAGGHAGAAKPLSKPLFLGDGDWLGAMTPKRAAKRAVTRNAIKRQIYQLSTALSFQPSPAAYVVRLAAAFDKAAFPSATSPALKAAVRAELVQLFDKAGLSMASAGRAAAATLPGATL